MALGKMCSCGRYPAGKKSPKCRNCRRVWKRWGEERDLLHVLEREQNLSAWGAPVRQRLSEESSKVAVLKRKRVA